MRHGDAVDEAPGLGDNGRWLTKKGRSVTARVASWLVARDAERPVEVWTSPLVRAVQTAEIVAAALGIDDEIAAVADLAPHGQPRAIARALANARPSGPLMLVGHEPSLSNLALALLGDVGWNGFKKSGVLHVVWKGEGAAKFRWSLDPKELTLVTRLHGT